MKKLAILAIVTAVAASPALAAERPVSGRVLLAIDKRAGFHNFLPTRMLPGFGYSSWSQRDDVLRVEFVNRAGGRIEWRVELMTGDCDRGKQKSFQLAGNKVWWAADQQSQRAWRCVFGLDGKPLRLVVASAVPPTQLGAAGLGIVAASAKRY